MLSDGLILALLLSGALTLLGWKMQQIGISFIAALGWLVCGLQIYQQTSEFLPLALALMLAFGQIFLVKTKV